MKHTKYSMAILIVAAGVFSLEPVLGQSLVGFKECQRAGVRVFDDAGPGRCGIGGGGTGGGKTGGSTGTSTSTSSGPFSRSKSGSKTKWFGKGKFGVAVGSSYNVNGSVKNAKVVAGAKPFLKGKAFGRTFTVIGLDAKLGNYNSYDWNSQQANQEFDQHAISKWKYYGAVRPFGITVGIGKKNFLSKKGSLSKGHVLYKWGKYYKKTIFSFPIPLIITTLRVSVGVFGFIEFHPTLSSHGITALSLTATPKAGVGLFAEGALNLLIIRAGIGTQLSLIEGYGGLRFSVNVFPGIAGVYLVAKMDMLNGKVYAFVDRWGFKFCCRFRWKRWKNFDLFSWAGKKAQKFAEKNKEWSYLRRNTAGFELHYDVGKTAKGGEWDEDNQVYVYDGPYEGGLPANVRGLGSDVYQYNLLKKWKDKHFNWMGKEQSKELWSYRFYDYNKVMDNIRKAIK